MLNETAKLIIDIPDEQLKSILIWLF